MLWKATLWRLPPPRSRSEVLRRTFSTQNLHHREETLNSRRYNFWPKEFPLIEDDDGTDGGDAIAASSPEESQSDLADDKHPNPGVEVDRQGQIKIISRKYARRPFPTALLLSSASTNLVQADFSRLVAEKWRETGGGLVRAIPGRDSHFNRLPYWIILFSSPYYAASYQHRLRWYHRNAAINLPVNPLQAATTRGREAEPPPGYIDPVSGEDIWKRLHEFSLLLPSQYFSVTGLLHPFLEIVRDILDDDRWWNSETVVKQTNFPMRVWVDDLLLDASDLEKFLKEDGSNKGREWRLVAGYEVGPMVKRPRTYTNSRIRRFEKYQGFGGVARPQESWIVRFEDKTEAMRFWMAWHQRTYPGGSGENGLIRVDPLW